MPIINDKVLFISKIFKSVDLKLSVLTTNKQTNKTKEYTFGGVLDISITLIVVMVSWVFEFKLFKLHTTNMWISLSIDIFKNYDNSKKNKIQNVYFQNYGRLFEILKLPYHGTNVKLEITKETELY